MQKKFNIIRTDGILTEIMLNLWLSVGRLKILDLLIHKIIIPFQLFISSLRFSKQFLTVHCDISCTFFIKVAFQNMMFFDAVINNIFVVM